MILTSSAPVSQLLRGTSKFGLEYNIVFLLFLLCWAKNNQHTHEKGWKREKNLGQR